MKKSDEEDFEVGFNDELYPVMPNLRTNNDLA